MRHFEQKLQIIIQQSGLNLNQISQSSGVSNPYLAKLLRDRINRPGKDKIASIMLALNYTVAEIDQILATYDYGPLHPDDIPDILRNNRARKIEGGNLPHYDHIYNDLLLVVLERLGGKKILVKDRPSGALMPHQLYLMKEYPYALNNSASRFRYALTEALLKERSRIFLDNIASGHPTETYVCQLCFEEYLRKNLEGERANRLSNHGRLVLKYLANALSLSLKQPQKHKMMIMHRCSYFNFLMQDADGESPKVSYPGKKLHTYDNESDKCILESFTTDLPQVVAHFRYEIEMCKKAVLPEMADGSATQLQAHLKQALQAYGLYEPFEEVLSGLLETPEIKFY